MKPTTPRRRFDWFRLVPGVVLVVLLVPIAAGFAGALLPAFGFHPALDAGGVTLDHWHRLLSTPGFWMSAGLSIWIGLASTALSFGLVVLLLARFHEGTIFWIVRRTLSPLLSLPHVAMAVGLAFVIAPSGLIFRFAALFWSGSVLPPDILTVHDRFGLALIGGLVLKEAPFIFLMCLAGLTQIDDRRTRSLAASMGYSPSIGWLKTVLPQLYPQIRLPVLAVLAYAVSVVDMALILGPTTPPTLAVLTLRWMNEPHLDAQLLASAAAVAVFGLTLLGIAAWLLGERFVAVMARRWLEGGSRRRGEGVVTSLAFTCAAVVLTFVLLSCLALILWAFADSWLLLRPIPDAFTLRNWTNYSGTFADPLWNSILLGLGSAVLALITAIAVLERDVRVGRDGGPMRALIYLPLLMPQIAFLPGLQILLLSVGRTETLVTTLAVHLVFVLPYVYLSLSEPWMRFDDRYRQSALALGASPNRALLSIRLPMLLGPLLTAFAVGFAISIGQYLPTILFSSGRIPTITTEAVALSAGGDRRLVALYALLQGLLPLLGFVAAAMVPAMVFQNRRRLSLA